MSRLTRLKRHELGSARTWNRRGTLGTDRRRRKSPQTSGGASPCLIRVFASVPHQTVRCSLMMQGKKWAQLLAYFTGLLNHSSYFRQHSRRGAGNHADCCRDHLTRSAMNSANGAMSVSMLARSSAAR